MLRKLLAVTLSLALMGTVGGAGAVQREETVIVLSDAAVTVDGAAASTDPEAAVYVGAEIVYYKDGTDETYGQGTEEEKHSAEEAAAHTVVTITQPGTYRLTGRLSQGQIAIDLGKEAKDDPGAVVTLILDNVDVTCTVAPALIFYNVYECDREWVAYDDGENEGYEASAVEDTAAAGANVILADGSENTFTGSHVARIYKEGTTKKLHKYDGAFYSRMSMNIDGETVGDGVLNIIADNEGLDSELHLTVNGGMINIESQDDGINTNEDFVSVTTVNGGKITINAGLGSEGDGIDSNGYLCINGGTVWTMANETSPDGGIDADSPIQINGGTLYAFGTRNDAADNSSKQPFMELSFASTLPAGTQIEVKNAANDPIWTATTQKACQSVTITTPSFQLDTPYQLYVDGVLQCWNGNSFGMGRPGGEPPERPGAQGFDGQQPPELPAGEQPPVTGEWAPGPFDGENEFPHRPDEDRQPPEPLGPQGFGHGGRGGFGDQTQADGSGSTDFTLTETTKSFSGVCDSDSSGKTRVSFTVDGVKRSGRNNVIEAITAITPNVDIDSSLVQVTVTDDPSEDYAASCLLSDGLEAVNALLPADDGDYTLTVAVISGQETYTGATQVSFAVGALPFSDLREGDEGYAAVKALYKAGAMEGTGADTFSPRMAVTRAQAVTVLARLAGAESAETDAFSDVAEGSWYSGYVGWAVEEGLVEGDGLGHFFPDRTVTAEEMRLMLERFQEGAGAAADGFAGELTRVELAQMLETIAD